MADARAFGGKEGRGFAIAVAAHVAIILLLSIQWTAGQRRFDNPPMEVDLIAETAPQSTAPVISETPPAARLGDEDARDIAAPKPEPVPTPPLPQPIARPTPAPAPKQVPQPVPTPPKKQPPAAEKAARAPAPKAQPAKTPPPTSAGRQQGSPQGIGQTQPRNPAAQGAPAAATAAEVRRSIDVSIKARVGPRWDRCSVTGVDVDQLKTVVKFRLGPSGSLTGITSIETTGQTDSNRFQVQRHQDCAKRAIELAAPFDLPEENYSFWQNYTLDFIKR